MPPDTSKIAPTLNGAASGARDVIQQAALKSILTALGPVFDAAFVNFPHIVLAVSGGSDSMALMHLVAAWRDHRRQIRSTTEVPRFSVVTIDHGLRTASADECRAVASAAASLAMGHTTLVWQGLKPEHGIQAAARAARYDLLNQHLHANGRAAVAVAHTADDQAETLLMRLARGSGIDGLGAMRSITQLGGGHALLRPLLGIRKAALSAYLEQSGLTWSEDPSNGSTTFERVRVRNTLAAMDKSGFALDIPSLARSASRAARASDALAALTTQTWNQRGNHACFDRLGYAVIDMAWLTAQPEDIRLRLLSGLINTISGLQTHVSLGQLENMTSGRGWNLHAGVTLHGTRWDTDAEGGLRIYRETGRSAPPALQIAPGTTAIWDRRFVISAAATAPPAGVEVLGPEGLQALRATGWRRRAAPARVLWTLPAVYDAQGLAAVPALGFARHDCQGLFHCETRQPYFNAGRRPAQNQAQS